MGQSFIEVSGFSIEEYSIPHHPQHLSILLQAHPGAAGRKVIAQCIANPVRCFHTFHLGMKCLLPT